MTNKTFQENKESNMDNTNVLAKKRMKRSDIAPDSGEKSRTESLKARFKAGSIPLQSDFADLIDMANAGWQATGQDSGQDGPGKGMRLSDSKQLEPDIDAFDFTHSPAGCSPVRVDIGTNKIVVDLNNGLIHEKDGLTVKSGRGITVNTDGVNIKASLGITADSNGVRVKASSGINVDANGISVKKGKGMRISSTGQLEPDITSYSFKNDTHGCSPVKVNSDTNGLVIDLHDGLVDTDSGLAVKVGSGIILSNGAVSIDQEKVFPPGIITMFSGSKIPSGWALCDGTNNTPDLRDRFIVMTGTQFKQGKGEGTTSTGSATVEGSVNVAGTTLTSSQIPSHKHTVKLKSFDYTNKAVTGAQYRLCVHRDGGSYNDLSADGQTESIGNGESHTHNATVTNQPHSHTISAIPPYYALAFIMKL